MTSRTISPFLWVDGTAEELARYHADLFGGKVTAVSYYPDSGQEIHGRAAGSVLVAEYEILDAKISVINGGPAFKLSPALSFFVSIEDRKEAERLWAALSEGGDVLMAFDAYEWSALYGWCNDRFGVSWQISWDADGKSPQKLTPLMTFTGDVAGRAREALDFYASVFPRSEVELVAPYPEGSGEKAGSIMHGRARLGDQRVMAMDSGYPHEFGFDEAASFTVHCKDQDEVDTYWERLVEGGGSHGPCGWLKDRFGFSWQVTPEIIPEILSGPDKAAAKRVFDAVMTMKKIDIPTIEAALKGSDR